MPVIKVAIEANQPLLLSSPWLLRVEIEQKLIWNPAVGRSLKTPHPKNCLPNQLQGFQPLDCQNRGPVPSVPCVVKIFVLYVSNSSASLANNVQNDVLHCTAKCPLPLRS